MAPLVTVITATYNSSSLLKLSLTSLIGQTYDAFEAWVVGDGCTDDSAAVVESFRDPRLRWSTGATIVSSLAFAYALFTIGGAGADVVFWGFLLLLAGLPVYVWVTNPADVRHS